MATKLRGIDVSSWQGKPDWSRVKSHIHFAMLRAGYGKGNIDNSFKYNASECNRLGIPIGVYWFSYAYTEAMARAEADYCYNVIKNYRIDYPVCFDFEYDSVSYANKNGVTINSSKLAAIGKAFLSRIEELGYYAMNYTNPDFLARGFSALASTYDTWLAQWGVSAPSKKCGIWQDSATLKVEGITGNVDSDYSFNDYATIIKERDLNHLSGEPAPVPDKHVTLIGKTMQEVHEYYQKLYNEMADEVIDAKWSTGNDRFNKLSDAGYDPFYIQSLVNAKLE